MASQHESFGLLHSDLFSQKAAEAKFVTAADTSERERRAQLVSFPKRGLAVQTQSSTSKPGNIFAQISEAFLIQEQPYTMLPLGSQSLQCCQFRAM